MNRVYVHEGPVWTLAAVWSSRHGDLPADGEYVVFETNRPPSVQEICLVLDDGRRLCDVGPEHAHGD